MLRHVVLFKWAEPLSEKLAEELRSRTDHVASTVETVQAYSHGPDLALRDGRFDYGVVADFTDAEAWRAYSAHPAHQELKALIDRIAGEICVVQFELDPQHTFPRPTS